MNKLDLSALMAAVPQGTVTLLDGRKIKVRAILAKEMKIMLEARERSTNEHATTEELTQMVVDVIQSCILDKVDVQALPAFELEPIFLQLLRLKDGDKRELTFVCTNEHNKHPCGESVTGTVNLSRAKLSKLPEKVIKLSDSISVELRYPNVAEREYFDMEKESDVFNLINRLVSKVYAGPSVMTVGTDLRYEEVVELMEYVTEDSFVKLVNFVNEIPQLEITVPLKCPKCGHSEPVLLRGLVDLLE